MSYFLILLSPIIVVVMVFSAIIMFFTGNWIVSILLLTVGIVINRYTESFALGKRLEVCNNNQIRSVKLLTFNLNRAYEFSFNRGTEQEVIDFLKAQDADIILLQEFNPLLFCGINNALQLLYPYGSLEGEDSRFKSVYSRYPLCDFYQLESASEVLPVCAMNIVIEDVNIRIFNCHLQSNEFSSIYRMMRNKELRMASGIRRIISSILQGCEKRQEQVNSILTHVNDEESTVLICGDLNDVGGSVILRRFRNIGFSDVWWRFGLGFGFSFYGLHMRFRLDHVLYRGENLHFNSIKVLRSDLSDHRPIVTTFSVFPN